MDYDCTSDVQLNEGEMKRMRKRNRERERNLLLERNERFFAFYKITHFFSFFCFGGLTGRPLAGAGPVSRTGCLNGRTMRINSQKTCNEQE